MPSSVKELSDKNKHQLIGFALARTRISTLIPLLWRNPDVIVRHPLFLAVNILVSLLSAPFKLYEKLRYKTAIANTKIEHDPVFILGHYRCGTTHLFNLLALDQCFAYNNSVKSAMPDMYLGLEDIVARNFTRLVSNSRPGDNMQLTAQSAQEDEYAMANLTQHSFLHVLSFPKRYREYIYKYTLFENMHSKELSEWKATYIGMLKKLTYCHGGKQILVKNPEHTSRLPVITSMFPNAKYVHIMRNPYVVYKSSLHLFRSMLALTSLQELTEKELKSFVLLRYRLMMKKYIEERMLIPKDNIIEICFEDLDRDPAKVITKVYKQLNLPMHYDYHQALGVYVESLKSYKKNSYSLSPQDIEDINREWGFVFDYWDYPMLTSDEKLGLKEECQLTHFNKVVNG